MDKNPAVVRSSAGACSRDRRTDSEAIEMANDTSCGLSTSIFSNNGLAAFEQYTETKTIWVDLGNPGVDVGSG